jgi:hypothetical protein
MFHYILLTFHILVTFDKTLVRTVLRNNLRAIKEKLRDFLHVS